jgi:hypothetical protein
MTNLIINFVTEHPFMVGTLVLAFIATIIGYAAPDFTVDNLVISGNLNLGTFCGTLVHKSWSHFLGNLVLIVPAWYWADKSNGCGFVEIVVLVSMSVIGIFGLISDGKYCGLSGVLYTLVGLVPFTCDKWWMLIVALMLFCGEFTLLKDDDNTSHIAHIVFFVIGLVIGIVKVTLMK